MKPFDKSCQSLIEEYEGIMFYKDNSGNKVFVLQGKLVKDKFLRYKDETYGYGIKKLP